MICSLRCTFAPYLELSQVRSSSIEVGSRLNSFARLAGSHLTRQAFRMSNSNPADSTVLSVTQSEGEQRQPLQQLVHQQPATQAQTSTSATSSIGSTRFTRKLPAFIQNGGTVNTNTKMSRHRRPTWNQYQNSGKSAFDQPFIPVKCNIKANSQARTRPPNADAFMSNTQQNAAVGSIAQSFKVEQGETNDLPPLESVSPTQFAPPSQPGALLPSMLSQPGAPQSQPGAPQQSNQYPMQPTFPSTAPSGSALFNPLRAKRKQHEIQVNSSDEDDERQSQSVSRSNANANQSAKNEQSLSTLEEAEKAEAAAVTEASRIANAELSVGQQIVKAAVLSGRNVFFTGAAGTGKSFLLQYLIKLLPAHSTFVTASTGIAAINIGGTTLHSFAGIGLADQKAEELVKKVMLNQRSRKKWKEVQTLIIDELSLVDALLWDKLEFIARKVRNRTEPFGGIQLVLSGDFLQLPPVTRYGEPKFTFESKGWNECKLHVIELQQVFRQADDTLVSILNTVRRGQVDDAVRKAMRSCVGRKFDTSDGIEATKLYSRRMEVLDENNSRLAAIKEDSYFFNAVDSGSVLPRTSSAISQHTIFL